MDPIDARRRRRHFPTIRTTFLSVLALALLAIVVAYFMRGSRRVPDQRAEFQRMAIELVQRQLKSPATAKFAPPERWLFDEIDNGTLRMSAWVDAQNSFGALIRDSFEAVVTHDGKDYWELNYLAFEHSGWVVGEHALTPAEQASLERSGLHARPRPAPTRTSALDGVVR